MLRAFGWKKETECLNLGVDSFPGYGAFPVQGLWTSSQDCSFVNDNVDFDTNEIRSEHDQLERATLFNAELVLVDPELASASVVDIKAEERAQCKRQVRTALVLFLVIGLLVTIIATPIQLTKSKSSLVETLLTNLVYGCFSDYDTYMMSDARFVNLFILHTEGSINNMDMDMNR